MAVMVTWPSRSRHCFTKTPKWKAQPPGTGPPWQLHVLPPFPFLPVRATYQTSTTQEEGISHLDKHAVAAAPGWSNEAKRFHCFS